MKSLCALLLITVLLFSCQQGTERSEIKQLNDSTSIYGLSGDDVKLVKTAAIKFKVNDVEESTESVSTLAKSFGGMVFHREIHAMESGTRQVNISNDSILLIKSLSPEANITLRLPSEKLDSFLFTARRLGYFTQFSNLDIQDRSLEFLEQQWRSEARAEAVNIPKNAGSQGVAKTIETRDEVIDQQVASETINADARFSKVELQLFQNPILLQEVVANTDLSRLKSPFGNRFSGALMNGWDLIMDIMLALLSVWPIALAIFFLIVLMKKQYRLRLRS